MTRKPGRRKGQLTTKQRARVARVRRALWKGARYAGVRRPSSLVRPRKLRSPRARATLPGGRRKNPYTPLNLERIFTDLGERRALAEAGRIGGLRRRQPLLHQGEATRAKIVALADELGWKRGVNKRVALKLNLHPDYVRKVLKSLKPALGKA